MEYKTEVSGFYKTSDGAIINKDNDALYMYKKQKDKSKKIENITNDILNLKQDIEEIKMLLRGLVK